MRGEHNPVESAYDFNEAFLSNRCAININSFWKEKKMSKLKFPLNVPKLCCVCQSGCKEI
jgi:hypothetical protein